MTQRQVTRDLDQHIDKINPTILHHGKIGEDNFEPVYEGTDYFRFICKECHEEAWVYAVLLDNRGRIIFNLKCLYCLTENALKITTQYTNAKYPEDAGFTRIEISQHHSKNIHRHYWDDY